MESSGRRLAAVMFTDIVGYACLVQRDERLALELLEEHRSLIRPLITHCEGSEIKTMGDGFLIEFPSAFQAVRCAVEVQRALRAHASTRPATRTLSIRIGVHLGDVEHREGDVLGDGVNIASRIQPLAKPGGICVSSQVYDQVENKLEVKFACLGPQTLKHIARPVKVYRVVHPWEEPPPKAEPRKKPVSASKRSLAVLPFANMSSDTENEYFSDGLTEDILAQLTKIGSLKVISRTSIMRYKGTDKPLRAIADELGVAHILEGTARRAGDRVRIVAQLINAETDEHLWAETYDRDMVDIFSIQTEIAQEIARAMEARITEVEWRRIERQPTQSMDAYTLYLQGRLHWGQRTKAGLERAIACFRQAIELDPEYAEAYAGLADSLSILVQHGLADAEDLLPQAEEAARRALKLADSLAEAHASLAGIAEQRFDWEQANRAFQRALAINPNYATAHHWYALLLTKQGRFPDALAHIHRARELDPHSFVIFKNLGLVYFMMRHYDRVLELAKLAQTGGLPAGEGILDAHFGLGMALFHLGRHPEAEAQFLLHREQGPRTALNDCQVDVLLSLSRERMGQAGTLRRVLERWESEPDLLKVSFVALATGYFALGELERGLDWLERAYEGQRSALMYVKVDPFFDVVREHPRFQQFLAKLGLAD